MAVEEPAEGSFLVDVVDDVVAESDGVAGLADAEAYGLVFSEEVADGGESADGFEDADGHEHRLADDAGDAE